MMRGFFQRIYTVLLLATSCASLFLLFSPLATRAAPLRPGHTAPRLANYFLAWDLRDDQLPELAKWDIVILDMENQARNSEKLKKLRELNPSIILLAYVTSQEIANDAATSPSAMRRKLVQGIAAEWYLTDANQNRLTFWPGTSMLNMSAASPVVGGTRWSTYLAQFVGREIATAGVWDGVFYDNVWQDVEWFTKGQADYNRDGRADLNGDEAWREGYRSLFAETRRVVPSGFLVAGNTGAGSSVYRTDLQAALFENFPEFGWRYTMGLARDYVSTPGKRLLIFNSNTKNTGRQNDYREMRFGLASALMHDGYFSFDYGTNDHTQLWWYDEYNFSLGAPRGNAQSVVKTPLDYAETAVWRRDFQNGVALVNPSNEQKKVDLQGDFETLFGTQDRTVNSGRIVDAVTIGAQDGLVVLKTFEVVRNSVFTNGSFARFFDAKGFRARNGIFVEDRAVASGARLFIGDLTGDGTEEKVIVEGPELKVLDAQGNVVFKDFPFGAYYRYGIRLAVGRLVATDPLAIAVAQEVGSGLVVYNHLGQKIKTDTPLGSKYQGGFTLAFGNVVGDKHGELLVGTGKGRANEIYIYDRFLYKAVARLTPYDKKYADGVQVAAGDVDGDGRDEIITLPETGRPLIRIFNSSLKKRDEYETRGIFGSASDVRIATADVNFDGKREIMLTSER